MKIKKIDKLSDALHEKRTHIINKTIPEKGLVLEIGPNVTKLQYDRKGCDVVTIDISNSVRPNVIGNAEKLPFRESAFDFIIVTEVIEHVRHPNYLLEEVHRVGKAHGQVLISTPNVAHLTNRFALFFMGDFYDDRNMHDGSDVGHIHFFTRKYFLKVLDKYKFVKISEWNHLIPISPDNYIESEHLQNMLKNFTKQVMVLCKIEK